MSAIRPIPDLSDMHKMARLGRLRALSDARRDAAAALRDAATMLQSGNHDTLKLTLAARAACDRLDEIEALESKEYVP